MISQGLISIFMVSCTTMIGYQTGELFHLNSVGSGICAGVGFLAGFVAELLEQW